jgi:hypothetical protein
MIGVNLHTSKILILMSALFSFGNALAQGSEIMGVTTMGSVRTPMEYKQFLKFLKLNPPKNSEKYKGTIVFKCSTFLEQGFINGGQVDFLPNGYGSIQSVEKVVSGEDSDDSELILVFRQNSDAFNSIKYACNGNRKHKAGLTFYGNPRVAPAYHFVYEAIN